ncbi:MAG: HAMP domain-containing protein, partial [Anaerolineae bacterium]|nr:HAMP domain-containing protein [Anaerolineae bacterium]
MKFSPQKPQVSSLRARVLAVVLVIFSPLFGLIALNYQEQRTYAEEKANTEALLITTNLATQHSQQIESAEQLLITLAKIPIVQTQDIEACNTLFAELLEQYSGKYSNIALVDLEGITVCSAVPEAIGFSYVEERWFQELLQTHNITFGSYRIGRVSGLPVMPINYPVLNAQGELQAIVSVVLSLQWFSNIVNIDDIPPQTHITVLDRDDIILARYPDPEKWIGQLYPNPALTKEIHQRNEEGNFRTLGIDDKTRLYAFTPLHPVSSGVYITVGIAEEVAFNDANGVRDRSLLALFLAILLTLLLAWIGSSMIVRPVKHLVETSQNLSTGDLRSRVQIKSSISELDQLADAFNAMAESIEQRVEQRTREFREANEKLQEEIRLRRRIERQLTRNAVRLRQSNAALENFAYIA